MMFSRFKKFDFLFGAQPSIFSLSIFKNMNRNRTKPTLVQRRAIGAQLKATIQNAANADLAFRLNPSTETQSAATKSKNALESLSATFTKKQEKAILKAAS